MAPDTLTSPLFTAVLFFGGSLLVLLAIMATAFVRIATVLAILRVAVGLPGIPPASIVTGLSLVLTLFVMAPVGTEVLERSGPLWAALQKEGPQAEGDWKATAALAADAGAPLLGFLRDRADPVEARFFHDLAVRLQKGRGEPVPANGFRVLLPAFVVGELKQAFRIGFLLFVPFVIIDLVVAALITAVGLATLPVVTVALPLKLLLFVLADGWHLVAGNLVKGFIPS